MRNRPALGGLWLVLVLACSSCASTNQLASNETLVTDSSTLRQVQRMVAVSVPGDSAKLTTRLVIDEKTGKFKPVTIFSHSGRMTLGFTLDAYGALQVQSWLKPYTVQVPVTDTEKSRTRTTTTKEVKTVKAPLGRFARFCVWFTVLVFVGGGCYCYARFFTPLRFLK